MALDFDLTEEQSLTRQAVRDFAEKEILPVAQQLDESEEFSVELTQKMAQIGLLGCFVPEKYGGMAEQAWDTYPTSLRLRN